MRTGDIPRERMERNPLITPSAYRRLRALLDHPSAPPWNYEVGDRVRREDFAFIEAMRQRLRERQPIDAETVPDTVLAWVERMRPRVPIFQEALPEGFDLARDWACIPTMNREDIALRLEHIVPLDADLSRLIYYDTSGITGHAIQVPHHPRTVAQNHPMLEFVLERYGIRLAFDSDTVACMNVGAQVSTVTFGTTFSVWNNASFAKVNLHRRVWDPANASLFFRDQAPLFLTGDPVGFAEMAAWGVGCSPAAMISTAVTLTPSLRSYLEAVYHCPVIDTYSTTETGLIAYANPEGAGLSVLPTDIYVEVVDPDGMPVPDGELGEICVTGGRNPFMPLLRYRTGDFARMRRHDRAVSDPLPCLSDLQARDAVSFVAADDSVISMVDIARIIREWELIRHEFVQRADRSCELIIQPIECRPPNTRLLRDKLEALFGDGIRVTVTLDPHLGEHLPGGKVVPFRSEIAGRGRT